MDKLEAKRLTERPLHSDLARRAIADEAQRQDFLGGVELRVYHVAQGVTVDCDQVVAGAQAGLLSGAAGFNALDQAHDQA
jgi:hypothetical protein